MMRPQVWEEKKSEYEDYGAKAKALLPDLRGMSVPYTVPRWYQTIVLFQRNFVDRCATFSDSFLILQLFTSCMNDGAVSAKSVHLYDPAVSDKGFQGHRKRDVP